MKTGRIPAHRGRRGEAQRPARVDGAPAHEKRGKKKPPAEPRRSDGPRHRRGRDDKDHGAKDKAVDKDKGAQKLWIYGRHAALAAIANPQRQIKRILAAESALEWLAAARPPKERVTNLVRAKESDFERALHGGAVHQGLAVEVEALPRARLKEACQPDGLRPVLVLDQITDPHNIGAIFRSAAAFGARAIIVQDRRTPPLAGALAKAAAGAVELVPCVEVVNIARTLDGLKELGYFCAGLAGGAAAPIGNAPRDKPVALVLGAEGAGLRHLVANTCDMLVAIPIERRMESLNVSNAAAVALYELARRPAAR